MSRTPEITSGEEETMDETKDEAEPSGASGGSGDGGTGEEGFLRCSVAFDIDGHKVKASHSYDYQSRPGLASMGWVWGLGVGKVLLSIREYMTREQWADFVKGIKNEFDEDDER
jgi:hypothetical protein